MTISSVDELQGRSEAQLVEIRNALDSELRSLNATSDGKPRRLSADQQAEFDHKLALRGEVQTRIDQHARIRSLAGVPGSQISGDGARLSAGLPGFAPAPQPGRNETRGRALDVIETYERSSDLGHDALERATRMVEADDSPDDGVARWVLIAGDENYRSAFHELLRDPINGHRTWTAEQIDAVRRAKTYERAMSLTGSAGGYLVPFSLDPNIIITGAGVQADNFRAFARNVTITSNIWHGVSAAQVSAEWTAEAAEVADASPTLTQPTITTHKGDAFVPFTFELFGDAVNFENEIRMMLSDAKLNLEVAAFTTGAGDGSNQPKGIVTALTGTGSVVAAGTNDTFALTDVYGLKSALPGRFRRNAAWLANEDVYDKVRQFGTSADTTFWTDLNGPTPPQLTGKPAYVSSSMTGTITALANNYLMVYGDWRRYVIVDRVGTTVELIPNLFGTNHRPTGQRGIFLWWRVGGDCVDTNAFRMLNV